MNTFLCLLVILLDTSFIIFQFLTFSPSSGKTRFYSASSAPRYAPGCPSLSLSARKCWYPRLCTLDLTRCTPTRCTPCKASLGPFGLDCCSASEPASCLSHPVIFTARRSWRNVRFREDPNQCLTYSKIVATMVVTTGIIIFTMGKQRISSHLLSNSGMENLLIVC